MRQLFNLLRNAIGQGVETGGFARLNTGDDIRAIAALRVFRQTFCENAAGLSLDQLNGNRRCADINGKAIASFGFLKWRCLIPSDDARFLLGLHGHRGISQNGAVTGEADACLYVGVRQKFLFCVRKRRKRTGCLHAAFAACMISGTGKGEGRNMLLQNFADGLSGFNRYALCLVIQMKR